MTLTEFLLARIAEDEALARDASVRRYDFLDFASHVLASERDSTPAMDEHVDRWEPTRVLARCEADRRIMEEHDGSRETGCTVCYDMGVAGMGPMAWPCPTLKFLALPFADHPDYRPEWKP